MKPNIAFRIRSIIFVVMLSTCTSIADGVVNTEKNVSQGETIKLECNLGQCSNIFWYLDGESVNIENDGDYNVTDSSENQCILSIHNATAYRGNGSWECVDDELFRRNKTVPENVLVIVKSLLWIKVNDVARDTGEVVFITSENAHNKLECSTEGENPPSEITSKIDTTTDAIEEMPLKSELDKKTKLHKTSKVFNFSAKNLQTTNDIIFACQSTFNNDTTNITLRPTSTNITTSDLSALEIGAVVNLTCETNVPVHTNVTQWKFKAKNSDMWIIFRDEATLNFSVTNEKLGTYECYVNSTLWTRQVIIDLPEKGLNTEEIVVIATGAVVGVLIIVAISLFLFLKRPWIRKTRCSPPINLQQIPSVNRVGERSTAQNETGNETQQLRYTPSPCVIRPSSRLPNQPPPIPRQLNLQTPVDLQPKLRSQTKSRISFCSQPSPSIAILPQTSARTPTNAQTISRFPFHPPQPVVANKQTNACSSTQPKASPTSHLSSIPHPIDRTPGNAHANARFPVHPHLPVTPTQSQMDDNIYEMEEEFEEIHSDADSFQSNIYEDLQNFQDDHIYANAESCT